ncbi:MAG: glycosyltransferase family 4 protein [Planctomycetes bacterium]|nr:glycosyltransferase family 4 protein [Planctomycetota bacterium]
MSAPHPPILQVITRLIRGGAQTLVLEIASHLVRRGWPCEIATGPETGAEGSLHEEARARGLKVHVLPDLVRREHLWHDPRAVLALYRLIRCGRFRVVHTHTSKAGFVGRLAARLAGVPAIVHSSHGHIFESGAKIPGVSGRRVAMSVFYRLERVGSLLGHRLLTLTDRERYDLLKLRIARPERTVSFPNAIDVGRFTAAQGRSASVRSELGIAPDTFVCGIVGRLAGEKGHATLLRAFARVRTTRPDAICLIVGDGPERPALEALCTELGLGASSPPARAGEPPVPPGTPPMPSGAPPVPSGAPPVPSDATGWHGPLAVRASRGEAVRFLGLRDDIPALLGAMDLFVLSSTYEGFGLVILEAMAARRPVVATRVGGVPELVRDGVTGLLVPPDDPAAMAAAIESLAADPERRFALAAAGHAYVVAHHDLPVMIDRMEGMYRDLLGVRGT